MRVEARLENRELAAVAIVLTILASACSDASSRTRQLGNGGQSGGGGESAAGDGAGNEGGTSPSIGRPDESDLAEPERRTGFVELVPYTYSWRYSSGERQTTASRLFYNFIPADSGAKERPIFVMLNGGPGATSMYLHSFGTGPFMLNESDSFGEPTANPSSWSELGSLLYIDSRLTGFSYGLSETATDPDEWQRAFDGQNLNAAVEAADTIRVVLRVVAEQRALRNNPIVLVGESAAGYRVPLMLDLLLDPPRPSDEQRWLDDPALSEELRQHYAAVFPDLVFSELSPAHKALQFGWQILIQPSAMFPWQDNRRPDTLGDGCLYHTMREQEWCDEQGRALVRAMLSPAEFETLLGTPPEVVPGLPAGDREGAIGCVYPGDCALDSQNVLLAPSAPWLESMGALPEHDRYFTTQRWLETFDHSVSSDPELVPFLRTLPYTHALITNAQWDGAISSPLIVDAIHDYIAAQSDPWVEGAEYAGTDPSEVSDAFEVRFADHPVYGRATSRLVRFPSYRESGHMVALTEGAKLRDDVQQLLNDSNAFE